MKVLVTGAAGLLGRSLLQSRTSHELSGLTRQDLDVTDREATRRVLGRLTPDAVIHCAALTDVDLAERDPRRAQLVNVQGTDNVTRAATEAGARLVYVSTDYVFDGGKRTPYVEDDLPRPLSRYGLSKREGEGRLAAGGPEHLIVRSGWLYGEGKGFVDWAQARLQGSGPWRFVTDQAGSPTWAMELARAIVLMLEKGLRGVYHFANRGEASWLELAREIARRSGLGDRPLEAVGLADLGRPAPRPAYSALDPSKFERDSGESVLSWKDALAGYLRVGAAGKEGHRCVH
jgi:dTDP-4-dehydrorhamnose reductase